MATEILHPCDILRPPRYPPRRSPQRKKPPRSRKPRSPPPLYSPISELYAGPGFSVPAPAPSTLPLPSFSPRRPQVERRASSPGDAGGDDSATRGLLRLLGLE
ncbi:hypothetical protein HPP92_016067 [Vanilla planifolia]|uniref:Uncharacterized protein n=1 Tax=Vanilla planifolia TaxID=51239 RepID=A0A835QPW3_VANPL|nr:hypothetical protein HPP92_016067 [Vanilla planifolia]